MSIQLTTLYYSYDEGFLTHIIRDQFYPHYHYYFLNQCQFDSQVNHKMVC